MYHKRDFTLAIAGKVEVGPYLFQHMERFARTVHEINNLYRNHPSKSRIRILDFGSLAGELGIALKTFGYDVHCIDIEEVINEYKKHYERNNLKVKFLSKGYQLPYENDYFDCIVFSEVLEHVYDSPLEILKEFKRILHLDGHLLLTTPNVMRIENKIKFLLNINIYQDIYRYTYSPRYALHFREYSKRDLKILLEDYLGYSIVRFTMFDYAGGRTSTRRFIQRCLHLINILLPMYKGCMIAIARNGPDKQQPAVINNQSM